MSRVAGESRATSVVVCPDSLLTVVLKVAVERIGERARARKPLPHDLASGNDEDQALCQPEDPEHLQKEPTHFHGV